MEEKDTDYSKDSFQGCYHELPEGYTTGSSKDYSKDSFQRSDDPYYGVKTGASK